MWEFHSLSLSCRSHEHAHLVFLVLCRSGSAAASGSSSSAPAGAQGTITVSKELAQAIKADVSAIGHVASTKVILPKNMDAASLTIRLKAATEADIYATYRHIRHSYKKLAKGVKVTMTRLVWGRENGGGG